MLYNRNEMFISFAYQINLQQCIIGYTKSKTPEHNFKKIDLAFYNRKIDNVILDAFSSNYRSMSCACDSNPNVLLKILKRLTIRLDILNSLLKISYSQILMKSTVFHIIARLQ